MTLYYLSNSVIPSAKANSIQVMQMCRAFAQLTDDVILFCRKGKQGPVDDFSFYGVTRCFQIRAFRVPPVRVLDRLFLAFAVRRAFRHADTRATVYTRDLFLAGVLCFLVPCSQQVVLEVHAPPPNLFWTWWLKKILAGGRLSHVIAISTALSREYLRMFPELTEQSILVAHDGASQTDEPIGTKQLLPLAQKNGARIGYIGSLRPGKGMELIHRLAPMLPDLNFLVIGGDDATIASWRSRATSPNLLFCGFVEPSKTDVYMTSCDVLLAPYQPSVLVGDGDVDVAAWMSPLKIFEYMRSGKPIIASDLPVLREVLRDGWNALLADPLDPADWKAKIVLLLHDEDLRSRIGANGRKDFLESYTWERRAQLILDRLRVSR